MTISTCLRHQSGHNNDKKWQQRNKKKIWEHPEHTVGYVCCCIFCCCCLFAFNQAQCWLVNPLRSCCLTSCAVLRVCVAAGLAEDVIGRRRATQTYRRTKLVFCFVLVDLLLWNPSTAKTERSSMEHVAYPLRRLSVVGTWPGCSGGREGRSTFHSFSKFSIAVDLFHRKIDKYTQNRFWRVRSFFVCFWFFLRNYADFYRRSLSLCQLAASGQQHFGSDASTVHLLLPTPLFLRILSDESGDVTRKQSVLFIATPWDFTPSPSLALSLFLSLFLSFFEPVLIH